MKVPSSWPTISSSSPFTVSAVASRKPSWLLSSGAHQASTGPTLVRKSGATGAPLFLRTAKALDEIAAAEVAMIGVSLVLLAPSPDIAPGFEPTKIASKSEFQTCHGFPTVPSCSTQLAPDCIQASARVALSKLPDTHPLAVEIV